MPDARKSGPQRTAVRLVLFILAPAWVLVWGYVAVRGFTLISDAKDFISLQGPGSVIPSQVLEALDTGQSYVLRATMFGAVLPAVAILAGWVVRGRTRPKES